MTEQRETKVIEKYNAIVIADVELEAVRAAGCLCLRCVRMVTAEDCKSLVTDMTDGAIRDHADKMAKAYNCPTAQRIFEACQDGDVAAPVTRCPLFVEKVRDGG